MSPFLRIDPIDSLDFSRGNKSGCFFVSMGVGTVTMKISQFLTEDLEKNTVNYRSNYDETEKEPEGLPSQYPNI